MVDREKEQEALNLVSMQMILHAGDARNDSDSFFFSWISYALKNGKKIINATANNIMAKIIALQSWVAKYDEMGIGTYQSKNVFEGMLTQPK